MLFDLLRKVCEALENNGVPYMLSGSLAMNAYTTPRMTRDIDIVVNLKLSDAEKFSKIFSEGFYFFEEGLVDEIKRRGMFNVIDQENSQKVDFIVRKNTPFHINEFERRRKTEVYGFATWIVSPEDLIISKLIWIQDYQSDTQMSDIRNLLSTSELDMDYVNRWVSELELLKFNLL